MYAADRYKAVVPMLFLFFVALWFILRDASSFKLFLCSLSSCFVIPFSIVITSLGEELGSWSVCFSCICLFVLYVSFCHFSLPLGVGVWLRFVIVAFPGLFSKEDVFSE